MLLLVAAFLFWAGNVSVVAWAVLAVCAVAIFFARALLLASTLVMTAGLWIVTLVVLFLTLGLTATTKGGTASVATGGAQPSAAAPAAKAAQPTSAPSSGSGSAARPTATVLKGDPPDALKPLIAALGQKPSRTDYNLTVDGNNSMAWLAVSIRGPVVTLPNWAGDTTWDGIFSFYLEDGPAKSGIQGLLKSVREDKGFTDSAGAFLARVESSPGCAGSPQGREWRPPATPCCCYHP
ncbi:MAG: hypothetical protein M1582_01935, partial [Actinobacteria bacterium]|nr:hypothetical protein [Actinomycetota bacterium]